MTEYKLPPLQIGALYKIKGWKNIWNPSIVNEYTLSDYKYSGTSLKFAGTSNKEVKLEIGSHIMVVNYFTGRHPCEALVSPDTGYCVDLIYNEYVYYKQWYYLNEWRQRFERVESLV